MNRYLNAVIKVAAVFANTLLIVLFSITLVSGRNPAELAHIYKWMPISLPEVSSWGGFVLVIPMMMIVLMLVKMSFAHKFTLWLSLVVLWVYAYCDAIRAAMLWLEENAVYIVREPGVAIIPIVFLGAAALSLCSFVSEGNERTAVPAEVK